MFESMVSSGTVQELILHDVDLSEVDGATLGAAVSTMRVVRLTGTKLTTVQNEELLKRSLQSGCIQDLALSWNDLSVVDGATLGAAVSIMRVVRLKNTKLRTVQIEELLKRLMQSSCIRDLNLSSNDLSEVDGATLGAAVSTMRMVRLKDTKLRSEQIEELLKRSMQSSCTQDLD